MYKNLLYRLQQLERILSLPQEEERDGEGRKKKGKIALRPKNR